MWMKFSTTTQEKGWASLKGHKKGADRMTGWSRNACYNTALLFDQYMCMLFPRLMAAQLINLSRINLLPQSMCTQYMRFEIFLAYLIFQMTQTPWNLGWTQETPFAQLQAANVNMKSPLIFLCMIMHNCPYVFCLSSSVGTITDTWFWQKWKVTCWKGRVISGHVCYPINSHFTLVSCGLTEWQHGLLVGGYRGIIMSKVDDIYLGWTWVYLPSAVYSKLF